jgi:ferritin-like metal-binding protein YciE
MKITSFKDMYVAERQELFSVEEQLDEFLLEMAEVASNDALRGAIINNREETLV